MDVQLEDTLRIFPGKPEAHRIRTPLRESYMPMKHRWRPRTAMEVDFGVFTPTIKAYRYSGVMLSVQNWLVVRDNEYSALEGDPQIDPPLLHDGSS